MQTIRQGFGREAPKDRCINDAEALGCQYVEDLLRNIGHVEGDAIAGFQPQVAEHPCPEGCLKQQFAVAEVLLGDRAAPALVLGGVPAVTFEYQGLALAPALQNVAVQFVEGGIGVCAYKPAQIG